MSKLSNGLIPAGSVCPFTNRCDVPDCPARQPVHQSFSCGLARGFDICDRRKHTERDPELTWTDAAAPVGMLVLQKNGIGARRLAMRYPVGGGSPADVPIADAAQVAALAELLANEYGAQIKIVDGRAACVGFRS